MDTQRIQWSGKIWRYPRCIVAIFCAVKGFRARITLDSRHDNIGFDDETLERYMKEILDVGAGKFYTVELERYYKFKHW